MMLTILKNTLQKNRSVTRQFSILLLMLSLFYSVSSSADTWQPSSGHAQIPIWPAGKMPDPLSDIKPESFIKGTIFNVSKPTMTIYSPKTKNTGVTIVVFPGGVPCIWNTA